MSRRFASILASVGFLGASTMTVFAVAPGFIANFEGSFEGFGGGAAYANPATGGLAGGGYLEISDNGFPAQLGGRSTDADFAGDYDAAGVDSVRLWLNDTGADDALEIHVGIGQGFVNFWQYTEGFSPPNGAWGEFEVDLTDAGKWTQIIGSGTFADAKANNDRMLIRHDVAPYVQTPDSIQGDFGVDSIRFEPFGIGVPASNGAWLAALALAVLGAGSLILRQRLAPAKA